MNKNFKLSNGGILEIDKLLGTGGEGSVYEVLNRSNVVAKIYHKVPDVNKQKKIIYMSQVADKELLDYIAWPLEPIESNSLVIGFLMPKITNKLPIHSIYSPAFRRQNKPNAGLDYLIFVARNVAACFESLHSKGHVIGDVNQGNLLVGNDAKVSLIDSDSFQIKQNGIVHHCDVGVPHFTPPELQGVSSFRSVVRTANHDNFGLALIIFHLLFGGRHPFSGVPLKKGIGDTLESNIKDMRYAYSVNALSKFIKPPPNSIPLNIVSQEVIDMFEIAFGDKSVSSPRPLASQWVTVLDGLRLSLNSCTISKNHIYDKKLRSCPWCDLENKGIVYFLKQIKSSDMEVSGFDIHQIEIEINSIRAIDKHFEFKASIVCITQKLPGNISNKENFLVKNKIFFLIMLAMITFFSGKTWLQILCPIVFVWLLGYESLNTEYDLEKKKRANIVSELKKNSSNLLIETNNLIENYSTEYQNLKHEFSKFKTELINLPSETDLALENLALQLKSNQLKIFLEKQFISNGDITNIGTSRKAILSSYGIETAADIFKNQIMQINGFGEHLTRNLLDWRARCERKFVFDPKLGVSDFEKNRVKKLMFDRKVELINEINKILLNIRKLNSNPVKLKIDQNKLQLQTLANQIAQAEANLRI